MDDIVQEFLIESSENLDQLDRDLLALESDPGSRELLSSIFRTIHTIKGTSGFLAFNRLESLTHTGESLLSRLRDGLQTMTTPTADALLLMVDTVRAILTSIEQSGSEGQVDIEPVVERLRAQMQDGDASAPGGATPAAPEDVDKTVSSAHAAGAAGEPPTAKAASSAKPKRTPKAADTTTPKATDTTAPKTTKVAAPKAAKAATSKVAKPPASKAASANVPTAAPTADTPDEPPAQDELPVTDDAARRNLEVPKAKPVESAAEDPHPAKRSAAESSLRVDVDLLDDLMRLAGELVLTRNQLMRGISTAADPGLNHTAQRLNVITSELQESIMKTRMQPIDHLWSKLPRVVRDLSAQCGRQVRLEMGGRETELDRTLLEAIKDPLTHLVRNAIDHGIESPADRMAAGKPAEGVLHLRAYHNSGQVVVEVADDGAGIDPERIAAKALQRELRTAAELAEMSDPDILQLVFQPGFSTAEQVTNVSGRGVGMDVVKTNIEAIGGAIEIESEKGAGTVCRLRVPLTLAIVPALTVECGEDCYAIPQVSLLELVAIEERQVATAIEHIAGAPVYRLRGVLLPLIDLAEVLEVGHTRGAGNLVIAVLQAGSRRFGLLVDRVLNTEEIVVKALSARLKNIGVYSGATILGDGTVALILDVQNLARRALRGEAADRSSQSQAQAQAAARASAEPERLLIAGVGGGRQVAISMAMVTRLEMVSAQRVEHVGDRQVVQYRGDVIPLLHLGRYLGAETGEQRSELPVAVYSRGGHSIAMVMDEIIDIVEYRDQVHPAADERGFSGSVVVKDHIIGLLDVEQAILVADPAFFSSTPRRSQSGPASDGLRLHRSTFAHSGVSS
jgi:two-component system chemotaxis sensor kinase CheA